MASLIPPDKHVRRNGIDYLSAFLDLLPWGIAWPREAGSVQYCVQKGLNNFWGFVDSRAADLLELESDPRKTVELLPDWERAWGLPDPCWPQVFTIAERQQQLVFKMTFRGGQSRAFYEWVMDWLGHEIVIGEFAPFMAGVSRVGDTRPSPEENFRWYIGPPEMRFYWFAHVGEASLDWFRAGQSQAGVHHHLEIGIPTELECLLLRWKPAHTELTWDFSDLAEGGPMQGTP